MVDRSSEANVVSRPYMQSLRLSQNLSIVQLFLKLNLLVSFGLVILQVHTVLFEMLVSLHSPLFGCIEVP